MARRTKTPRPIRPARYPNLEAYLAQTHDTQARLAVAVGATQGHISRILRGQIMPRPALARRLAEYCRIPLASFVQTYLVKRGAA